MDPAGPATVIGPEADDEPAVLAIAHRTGVPLVSVTTLAMVGVPGFLARVFERFAAHGLSIDLVATSQSTVTCTLDHVPGGLGGEPFRRLQADLAGLGTVVVEPACGVVSIVGRQIRTVLHELGEAFAAFEQRRVHLVSASSEDLNLSFVVDAEDAPRLVRELHAKLLGGGREAPWLGPTWAALTGKAASTEPPAPRWWHARRPELLALVADGTPRYVLDLATVRARAAALRARLPHVDTRLYAMKANDHAEVLRAVAEAGFGIEAVSIGEVRHAREVLGPAVTVQFTPNFCPVAEYAEAYRLGADVVVDGPEVLRQAPEVFRGRAVGLRVDPGVGHGHHKKVRTAGARQKFGLPAAEAPAFAEAAAELGCRVVGLHAHVGSGILSPEPWAQVGEVLASLRPRFPDLAWVDLGGGLGVVERPGQAALDLDALDATLAALEGIDGLELRIEPGRYLVSEAGVLLLPVTQVRSKGDTAFVGAAAGMNALLRPALYGAWHGIHNLTRWGATSDGPVEVVGPICETGDVLGHGRELPATAAGDVLLVENTGAYGRVMASTYNRRPVPEEVALPPR
jgi:diaminopimelate decarboxylase/aspartate kinase